MITFILGGSGSGKSEFAEQAAAERGDKILYVATAGAKDSEMISRIAAHKLRRPASWDTWEGRTETLPEIIGALAVKYDTLLLDSLTTFISALLMPYILEEDDEAAWRDAENTIMNRVKDIFAEFSRTTGNADKRLIAVSDEVGCGVVPPYKMGRRFRDIQGKANQTAASLSDEVILIVAGLPLWLKTGSKGK